MTASMNVPPRRTRRTVLALAGVVANALVASVASAQQPVAPAPAPTTVTPTPAAAATAPSAPARADASQPASPDLLRATPGALTSAEVARRAAETSFSAKASEEAIRAAAARVDAAWANYLPRLTGTARYTRLSSFTPPSFFGASIPLVLDNYLLQASVVVPISDYFLRINQGYTAATHAATASRYDLVAAKAKAASDGKVAYYGWLTARAGSVVAEATLELQKTLVQDAKNQFAVGNASRSDVLQAESAVAAAELTVERAKNLVRLTERQVRVAMHAPEEQSVVPGEDFESELPAFQGNLTDLVREAQVGRYEVKSIDANADAAIAQARAALGGRYPSLAAFADGQYANPNQRRFPQSDEWFGTWDLGVQLTWSPNDLLTAGAGGDEANARAAQIVAQKGIVRDGIELEVTQAWQSVKEAEFAVETTKRQLDSATEGYRVARELFTHGRATATQVREAETAFTRARLDNLNAKAQGRTARVRLDHALGRDASDFAR